MVRRVMLAAVTIPLLVACGSSEQAPAPSQRTVAGNVALSAYTLDNPVVIATGADGQVQVTPVRADGTFRLSLRTGQTFRLALASTRPDRSYRVVSELVWGTDQARWGSVPVGAGALLLGTIRPIGASVVVAQSGSGSDYGSGSESGSGSGSGSDADADQASSADEDTESDRAESCYEPGRADLPYDVRPPVRATFRLLDAFLLRGAPPAAIVKVSMEGSTWRLAELQSGAAFAITQADCDHEGNRGQGRDRIFVTWKNADGSVETDHLDMRYCKGGSSDRSVFPVTTPGEANDGSAACEGVRTCASSAPSSSECASGGLSPTDGPEPSMPACSPDAAAAPPPPASPAQEVMTPPSTDPGACVTTADCAGTLVCFASVCSINVR
jgi:hypothetical protein